MSRLLVLIIVVTLKILLCKGIVFGILLLLFWLKGKKLEFNSERWDEFLLQMSPRAVQKYAVRIYFTAAFLSSVISWFFLKLASFRYSLEIAGFIFAGGLMITAYQWHTKGKEYLLKLTKK